MSAQFGIWNRDGSALSSADSPEVALPMLLPHGPDSQNVYIDTGLAFAYSAFHTTRESRSDPQPYRLPKSLVVMWDGRLDNMPELSHQLDFVDGQPQSEAAIISAAYLRWGAECFSRLHGDWAVAIWDAKARLLILGKDFLGTRPLYYLLRSKQLMWSTVIEPLASSASHGLTLSQDYIAGWLSCLPPAHLTPYAEIASVPPASYVAVSSGDYRIVKYWDFDPSLEIRYRRDSDYEEHFRESFARSVRRRLRSDLPVLAHLSGGMDSSSIVCMADRLSADGIVGPARVETVSYFTNDEPDWNERPWFEKVEEFRRKSGLHIDVSPNWTKSPNCTLGSVPLTPGAARFSAPPELSAWIRQTGCRVLLSGFGGDEVTGGVPTPVPELQDLVSRISLIRLARQLHTWAIQQRRPWSHLLGEALRAFLPWHLTGRGRGNAAIWLRENTARRVASMVREKQHRPKLFSSLPSVLANLEALDGLRRMLSCSTVPVNPLLDRRYPFLDRELLTFLFAIPREQLVRPGQRRSLMRRALREIVPQEILDRRRKAYVGRLPIIAIERRLQQYATRTSETWLSRLDHIDDSKLRASFEKVCRERQSPTMSLLRATGIEDWLEALGSSGILTIDDDGQGRINIPPCNTGDKEIVDVEASRGSR
jgi:asparagine synthase (glutamine-hydrolysing)